MKFKIRDGFVVRLAAMIDLGDGKKEIQETVHYGGQVADLDAQQAHDHAHKLEPMDKAATAFLEAKVLPTTPAASLGITPEVMAVAQAIAAELVKQLVPAPAPASAA